MSTQERYQQTEEALGHFFDVLRNPDVIKNLGHTARRLYELAQNVYLPNVRHGVVSAPSEYIDTDLTPVITLDRAEELIADETMAPMGTTQGKNVERTMQVWNKSSPYFKLPSNIETINQYLIKRGRRVVTCGNNESGFYGCASIGYGFQLSGGNTLMPYFFHGKPLVGFVTGLSKQEQDVVIGHELTHVAQTTGDGTTPTNIESYQGLMLSRELEAYRTGAELAMSLGYSAVTKTGGCVISISGLIAHTFKVESLRKQHASSQHPYEVHGLVRPTLLEMTNVNSYVRALQEDMASPHQIT